MSARQRSRALVEIRGPDIVAKVEAAKKLATDQPAFPDLRRLLRDEKGADTRHAIVFAMSWHHDLRGWPILIRLLLDTTESPVVRAQAAEGLAYKFHRKRKGAPEFRSAVNALVSALADPSPEVRYFAVFALGASGDLSTLGVLLKMTKDRAKPPGFVGTIGDEAREAIQRVQTFASSRALTNKTRRRL